VHRAGTGVLFVHLALRTSSLSKVDGVGVIPLGANGWNLIGMTVLIGAIVLGRLPELLFGKYRRDLAPRLNYWLKDCYPRADGVPVGPRAGDFPSD
jgi:hypothetical protein